MLKKTDPDILKGYLEDSSNLQGGHAGGLYLPESEKEIVEAVKEGQKITISGAGTGTTGGRIPFGGWVLSTERLNKIINIDKETKTATIQPAVTLDKLDQAVKKEGLLYAPDPTEKTAFLGGTVATNASGARSLRFGSTRNHIRRLRVVLSSGEVLDLKRGNTKFEMLNSKQISNFQFLISNIKNAAGYYIKPDMDLIDLFIGSEGTLGIVTEIEVKLIDKLGETFDCIAFLDSEEDAVLFTEELRGKKDVLTLEYFDQNSLDLLRKAYIRIPKNKKTAIYFEQVGPDLDFWEQFFNKHKIPMDDAWLGMNDKQKQELHDFRHAIPETINELYKKEKQLKISLDIAVPNNKFREMLAYYNLTLAACPLPLFFIKFGHIGQSHLHVNLLPKSNEERVISNELAMKFVKKAVSLGGTVSAEHGIGKIKHAYLKEMYGQATIDQMIAIKKKFDPKMILNIGNIF